MSVQTFFPETLFKREVFEDYDEKEFIENLTYKLLNEAKKGSDPFSLSHTFEQLFDRSIEELNLLRISVDGDIDKLIGQTEDSMQVHREKLSTLQEELDSISDKFKYLEDCINKVGNTTVQIGNTLETVDKQKKRATEAKQLMSYFNEFNSYPSSLFETKVLPKRKFKHAVFRKKSREHEAAKIVQQLSTIAKDLVRVKDCENGITNIEKYADHLLHNLSEKFLFAINQLEIDKDFAIRKMKKYAQILFDINGVNQCCKLFVDKRFEVFLGLGLEQDDIENNERPINTIKLSNLDSDNGSIMEDEDDEDYEIDGIVEDSDDEKENDHKNTEDGDLLKNGEKNEANKVDSENEEVENKSTASYDEQIVQNIKSANQDDNEGDDVIYDDFDDFDISENDFKEEDENDITTSKEEEKSNFQENDNQKMKKNDKDTKFQEQLPKGLKRMAEMNSILRQLVDEVNSKEEFAKLILKIENTLQNESITVREVFSLSEKEVMFQLLFKLVYDTVKPISSNLLQPPTTTMNIPSNLEGGKESHAGIIIENNAYLSFLQLIESIYGECLQFIERITTSELAFVEQNVHDVFDGIFREKKESYISFELKYLKQFCDIKMKEIIAEEKRKEAAMQQVPEKKKLLSYFTNVSSPSSSDQNIYIPPLKLDVIVTILYEHTSAIKRCKKLSPQSKVAPNAFQIFEILIQFTFQYLLRGLNRAISTLEGHSSKLAPKPDFFQTIQLANSILQNIQRHMEQHVIPIVVSSTKVQMQCTKIKDDLFSEMENRVVKGLELVMKAIVDHMKYLFETEQKKTDYSNNKEQLTFGDNNPTKACLKVCSFLESQVNCINSCLYGRNRECFLRDIGFELHEILMNMLKGHVVSSVGAIKLMRDLTEYQKIVRKFNIAEIEEDFDILRELTNVFLVDTKNLENILSEMINNRNIPKEDIIAFVKMRHDYKSAKLSKLAFLQEPRKKKGVMGSNEIFIDNQFF